jgi:predicted transcriptional regulator
VQFFLGGLTNGLWLAFIGWYLNNAARASYQQVALQDMLSGLKARNVMIEQCAPVSSDVRLDRLVEDHVLKGDQRCFFVSDSDDPQGVITLEDVKGVSRSQRERLTAAQVMTAANSAFTADAEDDVWGLVQRMNEDDLRTVPILENGRLLGVVTLEHLWNQIRLRSELAT